MLNQSGLCDYYELNQNTGSSRLITVRSSRRKTVPYLMTAMAVLLILRGMNLGIPFISPVMAGPGATPVTYH